MLYKEEELTPAEETIKLTDDSKEKGKELKEVVKSSTRNCSNQKRESSKSFMLARSNRTSSRTVFLRYGNHSEPVTPWTRAPGALMVQLYCRTLPFSSTSSYMIITKITYGAQGHDTRKQDHHLPRDVLSMIKFAGIPLVFLVVFLVGLCPFSPVPSFVGRLLQLFLQR